MIMEAFPVLAEEGDIRPLHLEKVARAGDEIRSLMEHGQSPAPA
jgi:hypothetical protein